MATNIICESPYIRDNGDGDLRLNLRSAANGANGEIRVKFPDLNQLAGVTSPAAVDFFFISCLVYGIDRFVVRHDESTDGWSREISATFPVYNLNVWNDCKMLLANALSFLTGDYWEVNFVQNTFQIPTEPISDDYSSKDFAQVSLFSGGLDSLIGAIDFLGKPENADQNILLVSHFDYQMKGPNREQDEIFEKFPNEYRTRIKRVSLAEVSLAQTSKRNVEKTFRSRSLLFLGIAVLAADYQKNKIVVPENGSVSLNYPLSSSRRGSCSTRTTHPRFIEFVIDLLAGLGLNNQICNPYEFKTKGEMVVECENADLLGSLIKTSNSCGKRGHPVHRTIANSSHCGVCMPCTYRKASLLDVVDETVYGDDLNKLHVGRNNTPFFLSKQGQDLNACFDFLGTELSDDEIRQELVVSGIHDFSKLATYIALVKRTRNELRHLIDQTCIIEERRIQAGLQ